MPGVTIGYFSEAMMNTPDIFELFSGFIIPGANDSFPRGKDRYTAEDIKDNPNPTEAFYQRMIPKIIRSNVPLIGMCAGAQHLIMTHGGAILPANNEDTFDPISINAYTWQHFMMLRDEERSELLENCVAENISFPVWRAHSYAVEPESVSELGLELSGTSKLGNVMAYAKDFKTVVTQFHPEEYYTFDENDYFGPPENKESALRGSVYQRNYLNTFIKMCQDHDRWIRLASALGFKQEQALELRDIYYNKIVDRLKECEAQAS